MPVQTTSISLRTAGKGTYEITDEVNAALTRSGIGVGTVTVFVQHTSCSLIIMENADPTARRDLEEFFDRLVPENEPYFEHNDEGSDDMPSHIRMSRSDYHPVKTFLELFSKNANDYASQVRGAAMLE